MNNSKWKVPTINPLPPSPLARFGKGKSAKINAVNEDESVNKWPPRSMADVCRLILNGKMPSSLELFLFLKDEGFWNKLHPKHQMMAATNLAQMASKNEVLLYDLMWRSLFFKTQEDYFFPSAITNVLLSNDGSFEHKIFRYIHKEQYRNLAILAWNKKVSPQEMLHSYNLNLNADLFTSTMKAGVRLFLEQELKIQRKRQEWLISCLSALLIEQRHNVIDHLLGAISDDDLSRLPKLQQQLYDWYPENSAHFRRLNRRSQKLLKLFDILQGWNLFEEFVQNFYQKSIDDDLPNLIGVKSISKSLRKTRRVLSYVGFWSNYTMQFTKVKFFLPQSMVKDFKIPAKLEVFVEKIAGDTPCIAFHIQGYTILQFLWSTDQETDWRAHAYFIRENYPAHNKDSLRVNLDEWSLKRQASHKQFLFIGDYRKKLYKTACDFGFKVNQNLSQFRGIPPRHCDSRGLPIV